MPARAIFTVPKDGKPVYLGMSKRESPSSSKAEAEAAARAKAKAEAKAQAKVLAEDIEKLEKAHKAALARASQC